jgi:hypothetical protein
MIRAAPVAVVLAAVVALAGCGGDANDAKAPSPTPNAAPSATPSAVAKVAATCAPAPTLAPDREFGDAGKAFGKDSKAFADLRANFSNAYAGACRDGLFAKQALMPPGVPQPDTLFLHNAPDANQVAIYLEPNEGDRRSDMLLEYFFVTADGQAHVPSAADLKEAIYCDTVGASEQEQDDSGRCLVD